MLYATQERSAAAALSPCTLPYPRSRSWSKSKSRRVGEWESCGIFSECVGNENDLYCWSPMNSGLMVMGAELRAARPHIPKQSGVCHTMPHAACRMLQCVGATTPGLRLLKLWQ
ncbi:hypothetical protein ACLKA6_012266 [Drosophila palustris]